MSNTSSEIHQLFGLHPSSERVGSYITALAALTPNASTTAEIKSYTDAVYFNYFSLGLSLLYKPTDGYRPNIGLRREELKDDNLLLDGVDVYNPPKTDAPKSKSKPVYSRYPAESMTLELAPDTEHPRASSVTITPATTGKDLVAGMGEPNRKGGGSGPSSGSIGIWCEWTKDGILVEFGGEESRGPQAWERGKDAIWKIITFFPRS